MIYLIYLILAAIVVFVSIKCADYVDLIDKKTNLSGAFIGGVILAAVTSMPELITSITAIAVVDNPHLVMGNVLGSNLFNLSILAVLTICSIRNFVRARVSSSHLITLLCTLAAYVILTVVVILKLDYSVFGISFASLGLLVVYLISLKFLASDESQNEEEDTSSLTIKQIILRFIVMGIILIAASVAITYVTDIIAERLNLNGSVAGALFLGVATSLPELSSSVALVRKKNFNAMIGNIVGSNMFNYLILLISDVMYIKASIYTTTSGAETNALIFFGFLASLFTGALMTIRILKQKKQAAAGVKIADAKQGLLVPIVLSLGVVAAYFAFLFVSI